MQKSRKGFVLLILAIVLVVLFFLDICLGVSKLNLNGLYNALLGNATEIEKIIIFDLRIPIALMAIVVGFSLSLSGCILQIVLNNPLASPFSLGTSAAAGFGAALAIVYGSIVPSFIDPSVAMAFSAFFFSLLSSLFVFFFVLLTRGNNLVLILVGIAIFFAFQALLSLLHYLASPEESQQISFWLFGSLAGADYEKIFIVFLVLLASFIFSIKDSWLLTCLRVGDEGASSLGVPVRKKRVQYLVLTSLLTSVAISFVGVIGFIGIVAPHIARMLVKEDSRILLPCSALIGGTMLVAASITGKIIAPGVVFPIGIVTAIFGVPFFIFLILWKRNQILWN